MNAMTAADVLRELHERCDKAADELDQLAARKGPITSPVAAQEAARLRSKAQGVRLVLSYVDDIERRLLAQP